MKKCDYCGKQNDDDAIRCFECGTGTFAAADSKVVSSMVSDQRSEAVAHAHSETKPKPEMAKSAPGAVGLVAHLDIARSDQSRPNARSGLYWISFVVAFFLSPLIDVFWLNSAVSEIDGQHDLFAPVGQFLSLFLVNPVGPLICAALVANALSTSRGWKVFISILLFVVFCIGSFASKIVWLMVLPR